MRIKREYEQKQFEQLSKNENRNTKMWWKLLKEVTKDGGRIDPESIPPIKHNVEYITKDKDKAAIFNNYFLSISSVDESNAQPLPDPRIVEPEMGLFNLNISEQDVMDQISILDLNKAYGPDSIPPRLIKEGGRAMTKLLARLFNMSLQQCEFPKIGKVQT